MSISSKTVFASKVKSSNEMKALIREPIICSSEASIGRQLFFMFGKFEYSATICCESWESNDWMKYILLVVKESISVPKLDP